MDRAYPIALVMVMVVMHGGVMWCSVDGVVVAIEPRHVADRQPQGEA
jgi:hypothetical protein